MAGEGDDDHDRCNDPVVVQWYSGMVELLV